MSSSEKNGRTIVVLGGALSGPAAAARAREIDETARIVLVTREAEVSFTAAAIPFHLSGEVSSLEELNRERSRFFEEVYRVEVWTRTEATDLDPVTRTLTLRGPHGDRLEFTSLVCALGARPRPLETPIDGANVNALRTLDDVTRVMAQIAAAPARIVVVGAGLHGVAAVDGLVRGGATVTLVERDESILPQFGIQATRVAREALEARARVLTGTTVTGTRTDGDRVTGLELSTGEVLPTDVVILATGIVPSTELLARAGAHLAPDGTVYVTDRAETSLPGIFACGICVSVPQRIGGAHSWNAQGAVADKTAQVAGANAAGGDARLARITGSMLRRVLDVTIGRTGLSEREARAHVGAHFQMTTVHAPSHDAYYPGSHQVLVQLFWDSSDGRLLGAEVAGKSGVDKRVDIAAVAIAGGLTVEELAAIDLAYSPPTGSQRDPINVCASAAAAERAGLARFVTPEELHVRRGQTCVIDVRSSEEKDGAGRIPGAISIPLEALRDRIAEVPARRVVCYCATGRRGYLAVRLLSQRGHTDVANLEGGFTSWRLTGLPVEET